MPARVDIAFMRYTVASPQLTFQSFSQLQCTINTRSSLTFRRLQFLAPKSLFLLVKKQLIYEGRTQGSNENTPEPGNIKEIRGKLRKNRNARSKLGRNFRLKVQQQFGDPVFGGGTKFSYWATP